MKYLILFEDDDSMKFMNESGEIVEPWRVLTDGSIRKEEETRFTTTGVYHSLSFYFVPNEDL